MIHKAYEEIADEDRRTLGSYGKRRVYSLGLKPTPRSDKAVIIMLLAISITISFLAIKGLICIFTH